MRGDVVLRGCLLGLVLLDLVFVQLTGAAGLGWLAPLYALTLLAPVLTRLREKLLYRGAWNLAVLGLFGLLVHHATGADLRYVLEDGLVLAALCQVHLLNNLRSEQRPDLLFLNSFLIAIVTGYLCQDLAFALAFGVYAVLLVVGLQLFSMGESGRDLGRRATVRVAVEGLGRAGVLLTVTLLAFLFWPRDFHREGLLMGEFDFSSGADESSEVGFTDTLALDRGGRVRSSDRVVMTATVVGGSSFDVPILWRGATLGATNGEEWWSADEEDLALRASGDEPWFDRGGYLERANRTGGARARLSVELVDPRADRLFAPLDADELRPGPGLELHLVQPELDGTFRYGAPDPARGPLQFELALGATGVAARRVELGGSIPETPAARLARYTVLPRTRRAAAARELAERLAGEAPDVEQHELVSRFSDYLATRYVYLAPGEEDAAKNLAQFLAGDAGGHCEFFASALATMLRSRGVACRVATGYRSPDWDGEGRVLTFLGRHAHAWVEVHDPSGGWYAVDPNPAPAPAAGRSLWQRIHAGLSATWDQVAGFDTTGRDALFAWVRTAPGRLWAWARRHPGPATLTALTPLLLAASLRVLRRRRTIPAVRVYERALRRSRLQLQPGETPRELLARAQGANLAPQRLSELRSATRAHERARYVA